MYLTDKPGVKDKKYSSLAINTFLLLLVFYYFGVKMLPSMI